MLNFFQKKYLRFLTSSGRIADCQLLVVTTYSKRTGGCPWQ